MEKYLVSVGDGNCVLRVLSRSYVKGKEEKPWIEEDFFYFDAELQMHSFYAILEIYWDIKEKRLKIQGYLHREKLFIGDFIWEKDYGTFNYINYKIKEKLGIKDKNFDFVSLLLSAQERLLEKVFEKKEKVERENKFLYEPFLLYGSPNILVAPMGSGKTLFAMWLAYKVQNGLPLIQGDSIINNYCMPCKVAYLSFEGNEIEIRDKIQAIKTSLQETEGLLFSQEIKDFYYEFFPFTFNHQIVKKRIRHIISYYKPDLVIIDSITSAFLSRNELEQAYSVFSYAKTVFEPRGITTLFIMHPSKQDLKEEKLMPKGSILYLAYPRVVWGLEQLSEIPNGFCFQIKSIKDNVGLKKNSYKFEVRFFEKYDEDADRFKEIIEIKLVEIIDEEIQNVSIAQRCYEYLKKKETATAHEIAEHYNLNYESVRKALLREIKRGGIIKVGKDKYALNKEKKLQGMSEKEKFVVKGNDDDIPF